MRFAAPRQKSVSAVLYGALGAHPQLISYHTTGVWGAGSDDVSLLHSTQAPKRQAAATPRSTIERRPRRRACLRERRLRRARPLQLDRQHSPVRDHPRVPPPVGDMLKLDFWRVIDPDRLIHLPQTDAARKTILCPIHFKMASLQDVEIGSGVTGRANALSTARTRDRKVHEASPARGIGRSHWLAPDHRLANSRSSLPTSA